MTTADLKTLKQDGFGPLIAATEVAHPYLRANKRAVASILTCIAQTPCFLSGKPTPVTSSLAFLRTVLSTPNLDREDFVFVLVAIDAVIGVRTSSTRSTFKVFPESVDIDGWERFRIQSKDDADKLAFALSDVFSPTKAESANSQSCTNRLLKNYELHVKALEMYRQYQGGKSFAQAKQEMLGMTDREYAQCLRILTEAGLNEPRKTLRLSAKVLSEPNAAYIQALSEQLGKSQSHVLNSIVEQHREQSKK
jgi:hypothetical protein